jgi:putative spermidine/putrescine transport system substrate-binding protein
VIAKNNGDQQQLVASGQVDMALMVSARSITVARDGAPVAAVWGQVVTNYSTMVIPKGSANASLARAWLAFNTQPEQQAAFAVASGTAPANTAAEPQYDSVAASFNAFEPGRAETVDVDKDWWSENYDAATRAWTTWANS